MIATARGQAVDRARNQIGYCNHARLRQLRTQLQAQNDSRFGWLTGVEENRLWQSDVNEPDPPPTAWQQSVRVPFERAAIVDLLGEIAGTEIASGSSSKPIRPVRGIPPLPERVASARRPEVNFQHGCTGFIQSELRFHLRGVSA